MLFIVKDAVKRFICGETIYSWQKIGYHGNVQIFTNIINFPKFFKNVLPISAIYWLFNELDADFIDQKQATLCILTLIRTP